jgi:hypothetical protein
MFEITKLSVCGIFSFQIRIQQPKTNKLFIGLFCWHVVLAIMNKLAILSKITY